jgi:putative addiction module CopG family antidote
MPSRKLSFTDELEHLVQANVKSGRYETESEVIREALRALEREDVRNSTFRLSSRSPRLPFAKKT